MASKNLEPVAPSQTDEDLKESISSVMVYSLETASASNLKPETVAEAERSSLIIIRETEHDPPPATQPVVKQFDSSELTRSPDKRQSFMEIPVNDSAYKFPETSALIAHTRSNETKSPAYEFPPNDDTVFLPALDQEFKANRTNHLTVVTVEPVADQFVEHAIPQFGFVQPPKTGVNISTLNDNVESVTVAEGANFRASIFAGSVGANVGNLHAAKMFEREMNRKSYRQARADDFGQFDLQPPEDHEFEETYAVSRGELLVAERWRCVRKIAFGSTSVVYLAFSVDYEQEAAVKVCSFSKGDDALGTEANVYYYIQDGPGIPRLYWYGQEHQRHFLVTELLGPNLMDLLHYCDGKFSLKTVCMIAVQIFESLDWMHRSGYIHRDIRPQNFCMGNGPTSRQVFVIDFATAIKHRPKVSVQGQSYIPRAVGTRLKGHAIYDSTAAHYGNEHSYRDDVESALYMLVHFLIGDLPWRGLKYNSKFSAASDDSRPAEHKARLDRVCAKKLTSSFLEATPPEFREIYGHIRSLSYEQIPDYEFIIHIFLMMLRNAGAQFDYQYDWLPAKDCPLMQAQREKKNQIIRRIVPHRLRPYLALQTHRVQFIEDELEAENVLSAADAKGPQQGGDVKEPLLEHTEDSVFAAFARRDQQD